MLVTMGLTGRTDRHTNSFLYSNRGRGVPWGLGGLIKPPLWSLANIKCVVAVILRGPAVILCSMTSICSNLHDILHFQHQFFEIFLSVLGFSKGKIHFFPKVLKKWSSCQKNGYPFLGGGVRTQSDKYHFFFFFLNPSLSIKVQFMMENYLFKE